MTDVIRDVVVRISLEKGKASLDFGSLKKVPKQVDQVTKSYAGLKTQVAQTGQAVKKSGVEINTSLKTTAQRVKMTASEITDMRLKAADGFTASAEGALTFARGLTFLGVSAEDELSKVVENLAMVQGSLDLIKGAKDSFRGAIEGARALAASSGGAAAATGGLTVALGPVGIALATVAAAITVVVLAWRKYSEAQEDAAKRAEKAAELRAKALERERKQIETLRDLANQQASALSGNQANRLRLIETAQRRLGRTGREGALGDVRQGIGFRSRQLAENSLGGANLTALAQGTRVKNRFQLGLLGLEKASSLRGDENNDGLKDAQTAAKSLLAIRQEMLGTFEKERDINERLNQQSEKRIQQARTELQLAKDKLAAEKNRVQSLEERVGRLNPQELSEFRRLSQQAQSGPLSASELQRLEQLGGQGVSAFTSKAFAQIGQDRGGANLFAPFQEGGPRAVTGQGSKLEELRQAVQSQEQATQQIIQAEQRSIEANKRVIERLTDTIDNTVRELARIEERLDQINSRIQRERLNEQN